MIFCTLFDSNYLDKGIALYQSLTHVIDDFRIYVLAMNKRCSEILADCNYPKIVIVDLDYFVSKMKLSDAKNNRSRGEFCWTCTSHLIDYVLTVGGEKICTYVDSDLYFYANPQCLINEMGNKTVQIVEHRFEDTWEGKNICERAGRYCVEFNTFKNDPKALNLLRWWEKKCIESCSLSSTAAGQKVFGDQAYLQGWEQHDFVDVLQHLGGGVAPWNIAQYTLVRGSKKIVLMEKKTKREFDLVFYHFHHLTYLENRKVDILVYTRSWSTDERLVNRIYLPYLTELNEIKDELKEKYDFYPILYSHPVLSQVQKEKKDPKMYIEAVKRKGIQGTMTVIGERIIKKMRIKKFGKKDIIAF